MVTTVQTIRGPVEVRALGRTLAHEHLTAGGAGMERLPWFYDEETALASCLTALRLVKQAGIDALIDLTPIDLGRQARLFQRVAEADTGVHIVCATGVYRWVPMYLVSREPDAIAEHFLRELRDGIEGTGIRPGIIKIAWDAEYRDRSGPPGSTPREALVRVARGAARAAIAAGVPVVCHTLAADRLGLPLLDLFEEEGLDLRAVTIGHSNDTTDLDYLLGLARRGATIGFDRYYAWNAREERERRAALALALGEAGFAEQICLSHDAAPYYPDGYPPEPDCWLHVPYEEVPWLLAHGMTEDNIDAMLCRSVVATFEAAASMAGSRQPRDAT